ncbi:phosphoribosylglycinamide formyltransferase [Fulvivirgaceae bacterium PWU5]|uniref:Phosphoribosylglycinamide formyltransferase n=1 Tax=Dawidia cretensis TaxID=2782350 RepID=A0AAP2GUV8_9BACT|nr:phosphoribosylglycinamide formyltransferase [Dawidia cretensis]MBT1709500.1 phosphoribosylglycinamide formyltransferase [Dawidia cretensis]
MAKKYRIAILASGSGTNAANLFSYFEHHPTIEVVLLLSNNPMAFALERARLAGIEAKVFDRQQFRNTPEVVQWLQERGVTHVVLAGFLWLIPANLIHAYPGRIINIHPALLPAYGGKGMYGMNVHTAVKQAGEAETGITIHEVNEHYDEGTVLFQARCVLTPDDAAEAIAEKVHALEYEHYPRQIERWVLGEKGGNG